MKPPTGATPLYSLHAVALDTETTGLDPHTARIVQIGLVQIANGEQLADSAWERIVDPEIEIPETATAIHGIGSERVREAPKLTVLWEEFSGQIESRVVIGHTIGFDLAVIDAEAKRNDLPWARPRALCVRMLAMLVAPGLADHSLDALANWLDIEIGDRHQALADAMAAAGIFRALLPHLEKVGIVTLAQAERACLRLAPETARHRNAGWQLPVAEPGDRRASTAGRLDTSAYRHTVGEIMTSPVAVMSEESTLRAAMQKMSDSGISSVFSAASAETDQPVEAYGILTERDAMRKLAALGAAAFDIPIGEMASRPIATVRESAFVYRAAGRMSRMKFRHLGVRDDNDRLVGAVSARDLLRARTNPAIVLDDTIELAGTPRDLAAAWATLPAIVGNLLADGVEAPVICRIVSEEMRAITRRSAVLAEKSMLEDGMGAPPCPYALMILGSGGRGESMLVPDQDNAVIFSVGDPGGAEDEWFAEHGRRLSGTLDAAGIPYCKGGIMAMNELWRGSVETWRSRVDDWVSRSRPEDLLNVDIFFDAYPVHGDRSLCNDLLTYAYARGHENLMFAKLLGESVASISAPFTMFGGIRAPGNRLDLKMHGLFPITAFARSLAIRHNLPRHSSVERLEELREMGIGNRSDFANLIAAQRLFFELVLDQQSHDLESGRKPGNAIDMARLDRDRQNRLKAALRNVQSIPFMIRDLMFASPSGSTSSKD